MIQLIAQKMVNLNFKKGIFVFFIFFGLNSYSQNIVYKVNTNALMLRKGPGKQFQTIDTLAKNENVVLVKKETTDWWLVKSGVNEGYVFQSLLILDEYALWDKKQYSTGQSPDCDNIEQQYNTEIDNELKINVNIGTDVVVKLMKKSTINQEDVCTRIVYVRGGTSYSIKNIPEGNYYLKLAYGEDWRQTIENGKCKGKFIQNPIYELGEENLDFYMKRLEDTREGNNIFKNFDIPSYELELGVVLTNKSTEFDVDKISEKEFNE